MYFIKNKSVVLDDLQKCKAAFRNENSQSQCLKSENGGEYRSPEFVDYYWGRDPNNENGSRDTSIEWCSGGSRL